MESALSSPATFETALAQLQQIVSELEDGALGLEPSLARFEQGVQLLRNCYQILEQAEQKIELLTGFDAQGNPLTTSFDAAATFDAADPAAKKPTRRRTAKPAAARENPADTGSATGPATGQPADDSDDSDTLLF